MFLFLMVCSLHKTNCALLTSNTMGKLSDLNTFQARITILAFIIFIKLRFHGYLCESGVLKKILILNLGTLKITSPLSCYI